jgi:predicted ATPase
MMLGDALTHSSRSKQPRKSGGKPKSIEFAGEIALKSSEPEVTKAEAHFERALAIARQKQAKSWELRAAMSLARLWRDQGKPQQARDC